MHFDPPLRTHELKTERLDFAPLSLDDAGAWSAFCGHDGAMRFFPHMVGATAYDRALLWMQKSKERWETAGTGQIRLIERSSGKLVGLSGLLVQEVDGIKELEIGYMLMPEAWGKGYATEAAIRLRDFAFEHKLAESIISIIHIENFPSQRVAERNGMTRMHQTTFREMPVFIYRIQTP